MIRAILGGLFGGGRNIVAETAQVFRPNAENSAQRAHEYQNATLVQYGREFHARANRTWFDSFADGLNRLVRPVIALSLLSVVPATMAWPDRMAIGFAALAVLPDPFWILLSMVIGFYFAGRMQLKSQDFKKALNATVARAPQVIENIRCLRTHLSPKAADIEGDAGANLKALEPTQNKALDEWRAQNGA